MSNKLIIDIEKIKGKYEYYKNNADKLFLEAEKNATEAEKLRVLLDSLDSLKEFSEKEPSEKKYSLEEYLEKEKNLPKKTANSVKKPIKKSKNKQKNKSKNKKPFVFSSKMSEALEICLEMLRNGEEVHTSTQFYERVIQRGVQLSKQTVALILSRSDKIKYDKDKKLWLLQE